MQPEELVSLDPTACQEILKDPESHALAAFLAAGAFFRDEMFDDSGEPLLEAEVALLCKEKGIAIDEGVAVKITGLSNAIAGDMFVRRKDIMTRLTGAITEGDPFVFDEEGEDPTAAQVLWALYQADLLLDEPLLDELSDGNKRFLARLEGAEALDLEDMQEFISSPEEAAENHVLEEIADLRVELALQLIRLGIDADWVDQDPFLAGLVSQSKDSLDLA